MVSYLNQTTKDTIISATITFQSCKICLHYTVNSRFNTVKPIATINDAALCFSLTQACIRSEHPLSDDQEYADS